MQVYQVQIPYVEPGGDSDRRYYANIEVDAMSEEEAVERAVQEFTKLTGLSGVQWSRKILRDGIHVRRADAAPQVKLRITAVPISEGVMCLRVSGVLDGSTTEDFNRELQRNALAGTKGFIFDMAGLHYVNSTALGLMVGVSDLLEVRLARVPERIFRVMRMIGLDKVFEIYETVEQAAAAASSS